MANFSISTALNQGWQNVSGRKALIWQAAILIILISFVISFVIQAIHGFNLVTQTTANTTPGITITFRTVLAQCLQFIFYFCVEGQLAVGLLSVVLRSSRHEPARVSHVFSMFKGQSWSRVFIFQCLLAIGYLVILAIVFIIGLLISLIFQTTLQSAAVHCLIIAVIIASIYLVFFSYLSLPALADQLSAMEAFRFALRRFTPLKVIKLIITLVCVLVFLMISIIPIFIGLIWTLPWVYLVQISVYEQLKQD